MKRTIGFPLSRSKTNLPILGGLNIFVFKLNFEFSFRRLFFVGKGRYICSHQKKLGNLGFLKVKTLPLFHLLNGECQEKSCSADVSTRWIRPKPFTALEYYIFLIRQFKYYDFITVTILKLFDVPQEALV